MTKKQQVYSILRQSFENVGFQSAQAIDRAMQLTDKMAMDGLLKSEDKSIEQYQPEALDATQIAVMGQAEFFVHTARRDGKRLVTIQTDDEHHIHISTKDLYDVTLTVRAEENELSHAQKA